MADNPVAKFRRVFEAGLKSGKYDAPVIDVVQAVKALATRTQLIDALDVYVALFDPAKPPQSRNTFELGRTAGYNLFGRALELASSQNDLLELVQSLPSQPNPQLKGAQLAQRLPLYRKRYEALSANDKGDLQRRAKRLAGDRAVEAAKRRYLLDELEKEFRRKKGHPPAPGELLLFNEWPLDARSEFERLAIACEAALFPKKSGIAGVWVLGQFVRQPGGKAAPPANGTAVAANAQSAFMAFGQFLEQQIKEPLDLFRLLAWARAPSSRLYSKYKASGGRAIVREPTSLWSGVWPELYQDIVACGLFVALTAWKIPQMEQARGYVGKDLDFILAPLDAHWTELFRRRLPQAFKPREFADAQTARRRAAAWGDAKGLALVDEVESERVLKESVDQFEADPVGVLSRTVYLPAQEEIYKRTIHLFQAEEDVFTVAWIPKQRGTQAAYVNVHALPGFLFLAQANRTGLKELIEDKVYADLAANAAALTQFLLAYLMVVGLMLDIITAGASGGLRVVLFRFIEMRLKDKLASGLLDVAGVENPYARAIVGIAAGLTPSAIRVPNFKGLEELEHEAQNVLVAGGKFKPKPEPGVGTGAPKVKAGTTAVPETPIAAVPKTPAASGAPPSIAGNVIVVPKASPAAAAEQAARASARPLELPGRLDRARDYVLDLADRAADRLPALTRRTERQAAGAPAGMAMARLPSKGISPGVGGGGSAASSRLAKAATRLRKADDYKLLERYERDIMETAEAIKSRQARVSLEAKVQRGTLSENDALSELRDMLNNAKRDSGEFNAAADLHSSFDVDDFVAVPTRENGVPVLDVVVKLKPRSALNAGKKFAFAEGKGGLSTRLSKVTAKRYSYSGGKLRFDPVPPRGMIRQASGEWYYQKFAEIYMLGQERGGAAGAKLQKLANEMFDAARKGEVATVVAKSNVEFERKFVDSTDEVVAWFAGKSWDRSRGFPIPR
jgi:hypothetical protein